MEPVFLHHDCNKDMCIVYLPLKCLHIPALVRYNYIQDIYILLPLSKTLLVKYTHSSIDFGSTNAIFLEILFGYLKFIMGLPGIEPGTRLRESRILPLDYKPKALTNFCHSLKFIW